jgi:hypothetical protein
MPLECVCARGGGDQCEMLLNLVQKLPSTTTLIDQFAHPPTAAKRCSAIRSFAVTGDLILLFLSGVGRDGHVELLASDSLIETQDIIGSCLEMTRSIV